MTSAVLALPLVIAQTVAVTYHNVTAEAQRIVVYEWRAGTEPVVARLAIERGSQGVVLRGTRGVSVVVLFERQDGSYLIDGPFAWPSAETARTVESQWHRTIRGTIREDVGGDAPIQWIAPVVSDRPWPACFRLGQTGWACWGVRLDDSGVVFVSDQQRIIWTVVGRGGARPLRAAQWGRLLIVSQPVTTATDLRVTFGRPVSSSAERIRGIRLETGPVAGAVSTPVGPGVTWLSGTELPPKAWAEIKTERSGPVYLPLQDIADGGAAIPLHLTLSERRLLTGKVVGQSSEAAAHALVSVFRLIEPPPTDGSRTPPRRVLATETTASEAGAFTVDGLGEAEYEIVAWHPQLGRASVPVPSAATDVLVELRSSGVIRGRVLAGGKPVPGVEVTSVPDAATFRGAQDMTEIKGGDTRTDASGRFSVMVAASGGGELRIGGGKYAVRRITLPRPPVAALDLGDIDLSAPTEITIVLDRDPGCQVRAAGPLGVTGLHVVFGVNKGEGLYGMVLPEPGLWQFDLMCADGRRALTPESLRVEATHAGRELRFAVR